MSQKDLDGDRDEALERRRKRRELVLAVLLLLATGTLPIFFFVGIGRPANHAEVMGRFGSLMGQALLWIALLSFAIWRRRGPGRRHWLLTFAILYFASGLVLMMLMREGVRRGFQMRRAVDSIAAWIKASAADQELPAAELDDERYGAWKPLLELLHAHLVQTQEAAREIDAATRPLVEAQPLAPQHSDEPAELAESRLRLARAAAAIQKHLPLLQKQLQKLEADLKDLEHRQPMMRGVVNGFRSSSTASGLARYYEIQQALLAKMDEMLAFLQSRQGRYDVHLDQLRFEATADSEAYNRLFGEFEQLAEKENAWVENRDRQTGELLRNAEKLQSGGGGQQGGAKP